MIQIFEEKLQSLLDNPPTSNLTIKDAVKIWCQEFGEEDITNEIYHWLDKYSDNFSDAYSTLLYQTNVYLSSGKAANLKNFVLNNPAVGKLGEEFLKAFQNKYIVDVVRNTRQEIERKMDNRLILIIGFILAATGLTLYKLDKDKKERPATKNLKPDTVRYDTLPSSGNRSQKYNLVFVLKANVVENIIPDLDQNRRITQTSASVLAEGSAIEALWQGNIANFNSVKNGLNYNLSPEGSEFDVYLVEIEIDEPEGEFEKGVNPMKRIKALNRLVGKSHKVIKISKRLPRTSYNSPELYYR